MCGIAGFFEYGRGEGAATEELVRRMALTLRHRGPDGSGEYVTPDRRLAFGHRRLSIVDLAGGAQPMFDDDGHCLIFNGEIYNFPALREQLAADGVRFRTSCDTEIILHLYRRHGERCVEHLNGMFAFALWDPHRRGLLLARDHVGEKPLYWTDTGGVLVFASEIKAILEHPAVDREVNTSVLGPYLANLVVPAPDTTFAGIHKLPAGSRAWCDDGGLRITRYWSTFQPRTWTDIEPGEAVGEVRRLLEQAVASRLMSDVPLGLLLSGGFDSTTLAALVREQGEPLRTFTVGFPGHAAYDERDEARWVADHFGAEHHEIVLTEEDSLASLGALVHHQDEPLADPVCIPLQAVCRLAADNGIKVVLAGEGADELFWGYAGYRGVLDSWPRFQALLRMPRPVRRAAVHVTSARRRPRRREQLEALVAGRPNAIHMPVGMTGWQRRHLLRNGTASAGWAAGPAPSGADPLSTLGFDTQEYEFGVRLPELLLMRIDRFSMASSVESRVPFLDPRLVDFVYRLPLDLKVRDGVTKWVLKQAVTDLVPDRVTNRTKQGFAAPTSQWFAARHGGLLRDLMAQDTLGRYFDVPYLERLLAEADPTTWDAGQILWPILNFGVWHKHWIEGVPVDDLLAPSGAAAG